MLKKSLILSSILIAMTNIAAANNTAISDKNHALKAKNFEKATLSAWTNTIKHGENIMLQYSNMSQTKKDWIAVYKAGDNNAWANVVQWAWVPDRAESGAHIFKNLPVGNYEGRVFFRNSFKTEATFPFTVQEFDPNKATITTNKNSYEIGDKVTVAFNKISRDNDWVGIYRSGTNNDQENIIQWKRIDNDVERINENIEGEIEFKNLPIGDYEARIFFRNSYKTEAMHAFKITGRKNATISSWTNTIKQGENIMLEYSNMSRTKKDWIAVYKAGDNNAWANVVQWAWVPDRAESGAHIFKNLPVGNYEGRVFFRNSFKTEARYPFTVTEQ